MNQEEHRIQSSAVAALSHYAWSRWLFAIPNGGARSSITGALLKAEGVKAGVWDLELPILAPYRTSESKYHGLRIEVKTTGGRLTVEQAEFGIFLDYQGSAISICRSSQSIVDSCIKYMSEPWTFNDAAIDECVRRLNGRGSR